MGTVACRQAVDRQTVGTGAFWSYRSAETGSGRWKPWQWTRRGAHLLLQTRTRALDGTLRPLFERWHPGLANDNPASAGQAVAA